MTFTGRIANFFLALLLRFEKLLFTIAMTSEIFDSPSIQILVSQNHAGQIPAYII